MYIVTHASLTAGQQIAQIAHAMAQFAIEKPSHFETWHKTSQYIITLQSEDCGKFRQLLEEADARGLDYAKFHEPDLDNQVTAAAFIPHPDVSRFLAQLPLAGGSRPR